MKLASLKIDPQSYGSQGNAILGIRDSGKSYTAIEIAEILYDAGIPFVAFDPIGRWRFIRVPGAGKGYPVVVAGGMAGDLPLTVESAPAIVRAAMQSGISLVIDLYDMEISKADWRRIVADCVRVLLYENGQHGLRHIFIEEAAEFCPQRPGPDQARVYGEIEKLARMGGNARLGYTLINQRAEEVSKAVLELCDNLFLHRQKGKNSLASLTKWLDVADVKPGSKEIVRTLPTLPQGECWAWMEGDNRPTHIRVPVKNSFEPDRRTMRGEVVSEGKPAVDVGEFVASMKAALAGKPVEARPEPKIAPKPVAKPKEREVKESEASALRAENADLKRRLAALEGQPNPVATSAQPAGALDMDTIYAEVKLRAANDPGILQILQSKPEIKVLIQRHVIEIDGTSLRGRIARMLAEGFYDSGKTNNGTRTELKRTGPDNNNANIGKVLDEFLRMGFLTLEGNQYRAVADMKVNVVESR